jgi:twitching motility protein PilI
MAERASLREYQRNLSARLVNLEIGQSASKLGVQAGNERWLLELADTGEVIPVPALSPVPLARPWFAGVTNIRGNLYSVVDFAAFLGGAPTVVTPQTRLLLLGEKFRMNSGLLIDRVLGLYRDDQLQRGDGAPPAPWISALYTDGQANQWKCLGISQLIAHPDFLQVAA